MQPHSLAASSLKKNRGKALDLKKKLVKEKEVFVWAPMLRTSLDSDRILCCPSLLWQQPYPTSSNDMATASALY
jgi:hypothetical protein